MLEQPEFHTWEASPRVCLLRKNHFRLSEAFTEVSCCERRGIMGRKLFTYHAVENWGALYRKFLVIACGRILGFLYPKLHTDMQTKIHTHAHNILRLIICMRKMVWLSSSSMSHSGFISDDKIFQASCIVEPKLCIWSIPLFENIPLGLYLICLAANLIITVVRILYWCRLELSVLLWGVHTNAKLIICITIRYSPFHCRRLKIPFCLAEFPNIWTPYYFFESGVSWWATLYRGEINVTPGPKKKEAKENST